MPAKISITRENITVSDLDRAFDDFSICQITDIHHGFFVNIDHVMEAVMTVNRLKPDLVVLTGDYVDRSSAYIRPVVDALGLIRAPHGVFAVLGNHDHRVNAEMIKQGLDRAGIALVENEHRIVKRGDGAICIAGVADIDEGAPDISRALSRVPPGMPRILLSHNPDYAEIMPRDERVDLVMAGHTHGGQIRMPFSMIPYLPSRYGRKYAGGLVRCQHTLVYVSRGIGVAFPPLRFNCPPELAVIRLKPPAIGVQPGTHKEWY